MKLKQRQNHEKLATGKSISLSLNCTYYLMPSSWLTKWRNYINSSGKNISTSVEPEVLDPVIDALKCEWVTCDALDISLSLFKQVLSFVIEVTL